MHHLYLLTTVTTFGISIYIYNQLFKNISTKRTCQKNVIEYLSSKVGPYLGIIQGPPGYNKTFLSHKINNVVWIDEHNLYGADSTILLTFLYIANKTNSAVVIVCSDNSTKFTNDGFNYIEFDDIKLYEVN